MKILTLTSLFPNSVQPVRSITHKYRATHIAKHCDLKVVSPVPLFPPIKFLKKWHIYSQIPSREVIDSVEVLHPRYIFPPIMGRRLHGAFYFAAMLPYLWWLKRTFHFELIDVIWGYPDGYAGSLIGRLLNVPVTVRVVGSDIHEYREVPTIRRLLVSGLKRCQRVFTVSHALKNMMIGLGVSGEKIQVLYNGMAIKGFHPEPKRERAKKRIVFVGDLIPIKGVDFLLDAFAKVRYSKHEVELIMIGKGGLHAELEQKIETYGLRDRVKLLGARVHEEVAEFVRGSDLLVLPSRNEGLPNVIVEALFCHVPSVATNVGGTKEAMGEYGVLVNPEDPDDLARGIDQALETEWDFTNVDKHLSQFSWERNAKMSIEAFEQLISGEDRTEVNSL